MTFAPTRRVLGIASLTITSATGTRTVTVVHEGQAAGKAGCYIEGPGFVCTVAESTTGAAPPTGIWNVYVVEDNIDVSNNYETTDAGGTLSTSVLACFALGTGGALPAHASLGAGTGVNAAILKGGTYRMVLTAGDTAARSRRIAAVTDTGVTSSQFHQDSDGGSANGTLGATGSLRDIGGCGRRIAWTARGSSGSSGGSGRFRYRDTMTLTGSLRPVDAGSTALINPKAIKIALSTNASGATRPDGVYRPTPNTTGDFSQGSIPIDTDFGQTLGGTNHYYQIGVDDVLGDSTTPAGEQAGIWSTGTVVGLANTELAWCVFTDNSYIADDSGNHRIGVVKGTTSIVTSPFSGGFGNAVDVDGVGASDAPGPVGPPILGNISADWTVEVKMRRDAFISGGAQPVIYWAKVSPNEGFAIEFDSSDKLAAYCYSGGTLVATLTSASVVSLANHDIAFERSGTTMRLYLDGAVVASTTLATWTAVGARFSVGRDSYGSPYSTDSVVDNFRFSNIARYSGAYTPPSAPFTSDANTLALWAMEAIGSTANQGTIVSAGEQLRSPTAEIVISAAIQVFKDSGLSQAGVGVFSSSGYTTAQNIFKRRGPVNTTNAIPYMEVYIADAYGGKYASVTNGFTEDTQRMSDSVSSDLQTVSTDANGRVRWNYTISATSAAFNRYVKTGTTRVTGSHVATGPDDPLSPPATFSVGNGLYTGPFPGYGRKVVTKGTGFSGGKEPSITVNNLFGVNSEIIFEDMWTGILSNAQLDGNGVPNGPGSRNFVIPNSAKCKLSTLINEGNVRIIDLAEVNPKDVAGRSIDLAGAEVLSGRRSLWNITTGNADDTGTNLSNSFNLDTPLGYATGTSSLDTVASPSDPGSFTYFQAYKDLVNGNEATEDSSGFLMASLTNVGFQTDNGNFGYFSQGIAWVNPDLSLALALTPKVAQSDPGLTQRFGIKVFRVTSDAFVAPDVNAFAPAHPDEAPIYVVWGLNSDGTQTFITSGSATALGTPSTTADYYFDLVIPTSPIFDAIKINAFARVSGSPVAGGGEAQIQVGYTFDGAGFATGFPFK